jgi:hypothetical protein
VTQVKTSLEYRQGDAVNAVEISGDLWIRVGVPGEKQES